MALLAKMKNGGKYGEKAKSRIFYSLLNQFQNLLHYI